MENGEMTMLEVQNTLFEIKQELARHSEQISGALHRIDEQTKLTESVHELAASVKLLTSEQKHILEKVNETNQKLDGVSNDVEELKAKPAKRWDSATTVIITAVITAIITFVLTQIGLK